MTSRTVESLLLDLSRRGVSIWADGDKLRLSAPRGVLDGVVQDALKQNKTSILAFLRNAHRAVPSIEPTSRKRELPLSFAQERLWFVDQLMPGASGYHVPMRIRLTGPLNRKALQLSLVEIARRHEALRTRLPATEGRPHQIVMSDLSINVPLTDLAALSACEQVRQLERLAGEEARRAIDLASGPLLRARLLKLGQAEHVLLLTMHHIVCDGWSLGVLFKELGALYGAFQAGRTSPLEPLAVQYADYAAWQRAWLQGEVLERQLVYWREQLRGLSTLELPTDRPRPVMQTFAAAGEAAVVPPTLSEQLKLLGQRENATLYMVLLAAFKVLLYRYTGQDDLVVGSPVANRNLREIEPLIGFFVNTLVMRTQFSGHPTFRELLARVRETALGAYAHQDLPFEKLVEVLQPARDTSRNPLFQALFAVQNAPMAPLELEGLTLSLEPMEAVTTAFDLETHVWESATGLTISLIYNTDLFEPATIRRVLGHYQRILEGIVAEPSRRISDLPLLTDAERRQILLEWNATESAYPRDQCLHELFEQQVERTPKAVAAVFEGRELTYEQLNARANQLARHLRRIGVGPERRVGVCLPRSRLMTIAVLATLKAGGVYVPLDPAHPAERLALMVADAQISAVLTLGRLRARVPGCEAETICLDADADAWRDESAENLAIGRGPGRAAYMIYTSGTTGVPKGIVMEHGVLCNLVHWQRAHASVGVAARTLQFASLSFDVSIQELFATWCAGGALVLVPEPVRRDPMTLVRFLDQARVERIFVPFAALQQLAEAVAATGIVPGSLREVVTAGEQLRITPAIVSWFRSMPDCVLENQYGPTESHVVTSFRLDGDSREWPLLPPIGRPIENARVYVLDARLQPVPVGVAGELYIGGVSVARGYLNRPALTQERFLPDPFSPAPGARMYCTGDLARYRADGCIEFLGRTDQQVKVRGYRVEPGEVEAVLAGHPKVREVAVVAPADASGWRRLVAYYVPGTEPGVSANELKAYLRRKLPEYLVPTLYRSLDKLPLTPSGKVDRRALPALEAGRWVEATYTAPRTELERALAGIWAEVLGVERVGVHDDFFDLGGHSLLGVRLMSKIEKCLGVSLPLPALFRFSTIEGMASAIEAGGSGDRLSNRAALDEGGSNAGLSEAEYRDMLKAIAGCRVPPVRPGSLMLGLHTDGREPPLFWCFNRPSFEAPNLARELGRDQPLYGLFSGSEVVEQDEDWIRRLAHYYVEEIMRTQPAGPYRIGGNCGGGWVACQIAFQLFERGKDVEKLCVMEYFEPRLFDYPGPLQILYGRESHLRVQERFHWNQPGWEKQFRNAPGVDWIPGAHGQFFKESNVQVLGQRVRRFLSDRVAIEQVSARALSGRARVAKH